jgi:plastocyanin
MKNLTGRIRSIWELECSFSRLGGRATCAAVRALMVVALLGVFSGFLEAVTVEAHVEYAASSKKIAVTDASNVVLWLTPLSGPAITQAGTALHSLPRHFQLVQSHKRFDPHLLVVPVGSLVDFPNKDPFFHNVFSLFDGKRFDLGLYAAGSTRSVKFDRPGVSFIFCNIHPQMSAVVVTMKTPYYGVTNKAGKVHISGVPDGRYQIQIWSERALPATLKNLDREVTIDEDTHSLGTFRIKASGDLLAHHKNKYGRDYDPVISVSPLYGEPE